MQFEQSDITIDGALDALLASVDTVYHVASIVDVSLNPNPMIDLVNVTGTRNVIDSCLRCSVKKLVYTSTMDVVFDYEREFRLALWCCALCVVRCCTAQCSALFLHYVSRMFLGFDVRVGSAPQRDGVSANL